MHSEAPNPKKKLMMIKVLPYIFKYQGQGVYGKII